jgi:hypothetical protein
VFNGWLFYNFSITFLSDTPGTVHMIIFLLCQYQYIQKQWKSVSSQNYTVLYSGRVNSLACCILMNSLI